MKRLTNFIRNLNLSSKFAGAYTIILIVQVILTGVYLYVQASSSAVKQGELVMEQNLIQTRASILQKVKLIENIQSIIAFNNDIQYFLEYWNDSHDYDNYQVEDYQFNYHKTIENILVQNANLDSIKLYVDGNIITEKSNTFSGVSDKLEPELYNRLLKTKPTEDGWSSVHEISDIYTNKASQVFSYFTPIISMNSYRKVASLEINIKEDSFFDMVRDPVESKLGKVFIIDKNSKVVSRNIPQFFNKSIKNVGIAPFDIKKKQVYIKKINNVKSVVMSIPIKEINCSVVGVFPVSKFNVDVRDSLVSILFVVLLSSLLIGVIIYVVTKLLLKRLGILVKAMKQVRDGNLNVSVEVKSTDEFGQLGLNFNHMTKRINDLVETVYKIEIMEKEAEIKALESQINPHFLYNILASISWSARREKSSDVVKITNALAKFYRLVLNKGGTLISVKEEIEIAKSYLFMQKIRFESIFDVVYSLDETINEDKIIKNILQPLLENALSHGIEEKRKHGTIIIKTGQDSQNLYFKIIDDGVGMNKRNLEEVMLGTVKSKTGSGYAIKNIAKRLEAYYGENHSFMIYSRLGIGTEVIISIKK